MLAIVSMLFFHYVVFEEKSKQSLRSITTLNSTRKRQLVCRLWIYPRSIHLDERDRKTTVMDHCDSSIRLYGSMVM